MGGYPFAEYTTVAWDNSDGTTFTGYIWFEGPTVHIERVDGMQCSVDAGRLRIATPEDVAASRKHFNLPELEQ